MVKHISLLTTSKLSEQKTINFKDGNIKKKKNHHPHRLEIAFVFKYAFLCDFRNSNRPAKLTQRNC